MSLGANRYPSNAAALALPHVVDHTEVPKMICGRCAALKPNVDELQAWVRGDHAGAACRMRARTGKTWTECIWSLLGAAREGGAE